VEKGTPVPRLVQQQLRILSRAVSQCADSVVITDRNGRIEYVNPAFERLTGYQSHEARGNLAGNKRPAPVRARAGTEGNGRHGNNQITCGIRG
ncbi:MAG: PAS domain S-box protein, partial [Armatimonadetes bacterium]|nr:PAS domain S-box protein [Armatimonadota bacterium]